MTKPKSISWQAIAKLKKRTITIKDLKQLKGFEHFSDRQAEIVLSQLQQWARIITRHTIKVQVNK